MNEFHYAFKVKDIVSTRQFYMAILGCTEGRSTETWIDFDFFGHQLSAHISDYSPPLDFCGKVDGISVPIPHFGCILTYQQFAEVQMALMQNDTKFIVKPNVRYAGQVGEQLTMFLVIIQSNLKLSRIKLKFLQSNQN